MTNKREKFYELLFTNEENCNLTDNIRQLLTFIDDSESCRYEDIMSYILKDLTIYNESSDIIFKDGPLFYFLNEYSKEEAHYLKYEYYMSDKFYELDTSKG